jgi:hypothetical protein
MAKLEMAISALRKKHENGEGIVDGSQISYKEILEILSETRIREIEIFQNLRDLIVSEIAYGLGMHLGESGPERPEHTLQYEGVTALVQLFNEVLKVQKRLRNEVT